jgi:hypothetical protein
MEATLLRPLPPFRAKPVRKSRTLKTPSGDARKPLEVSVKAHRLPVRFARLAAAPALKVLGRPATHA